MADPKVYEKADLLTVYDGQAEKGEKVGAFKTRKTRGGIPPLETITVHEVYATTTVYFSEAKKWLIVDQNIYVTEGGLSRLPKWHFYNDKSEMPNLQIIQGAYNSADITKRITIEVEKWKHRCELDVPADYPTPDDAQPAFISKVLDGVRAEYAKQGATIDADGVIHVGADEASDAQPEPQAA